MSNFAKRTLTAVLGGALMVVFLILGGDWLTGLLFIASVIGYYELSGAFGIHSDEKKAGIMDIAAYITILAWYALLELDLHGLLGEARLSFLQLWVLIISLMVHMAVYVLTYPRYDSEQTVGSFFSVIYCPVLMSYICMVRASERGHLLIWMVFICSWMCDTCAYLVGMKIGKHKMSPVLSPKKSIEGAVGGALGSVVAGCVYCALVLAPGSGTDKWKSVAITGILCLCGALISMIGDLAASAIKRNHDIKDYGNLLPGHGGIMDRFDSVIFVAPVIYLLSFLI